MIHSAIQERVATPDDLRELADHLERAVAAAQHKTTINAALARRFLLSEREAEVLALLADGHTYQQCAKVLGVAHSTAKTHAFHCYRKLRAINAGHAIAIGFRLGILQ